MLLKWLICAAVFNLFPVYVFSNIVSRKKRSDDFVPCDNGWFNFGDKCFKVGGRKKPEKLSWDKAEARCIRYGGHLASIQSVEELDYIFTFLLMDIKDSLWIGLNDRDTESVYVWADGANFNFTNWRDSEPTGVKDEKEDCIEMLFEPLTPIKGQWNDMACDKKLGYLCQMRTSTQKRSPNPQYCSSEEGGGWKYQNSCYHIVEETETWQNAEQHCKDSFNGHLVTILDITVDLYLNHILSKTNKEFWLGIKLQPQLQQTWTSDYFVSYHKIKTSENTDSSEESCVLRRRKDLWITVPCSDQHSFICEVSKDRPTILESPANAYCPESPVGWRDLGGEYCYYIETKIFTTWFQADFDCKRRGGNLLSIHSKEVSDVLHTFVIYTQPRIFIGFYRLMANEDVFVWEDGSNWDYENWAPTEPNSEDEKCGEIWTPDMAWNDVSCFEKKGYICSIKKILPDSAVTEKTECPKCPIIPRRTVVEKAECPVCPDIPSTTGVEKTQCPECPAISNTAVLEKTQCPECPVLPNTTVVEETQCPVLPNTTVVEKTVCPDTPNITPTEKIQYSVISNAIAAERIQCDIIPNTTTIQCAVKPNTTATTAVDTTKCTGPKYVKALIGISIGLLLMVIILGFMICYFRPWKLNRRKDSTELTIKHEGGGYDMM